MIILITTWRERERERDLYTLTNRKREGERGRGACDNRKREGGELVVFMCTTSERMLNYSIYGLRFSTVKDFTTHTHPHWIYVLATLWIKRKVKDERKKGITFTFQSLFQNSKHYHSTMITKSRRLVSMNRQYVRAYNIIVYLSSLSCEHKQISIMMTAWLTH